METKVEAAKPQTETQVECEAEVAPGPGFNAGWDSSRPSRELNPANILRLQRTIGNQAVQRIITQHKATQATESSEVQRLMSKNMFQAQSYSTMRGEQNPFLQEIHALLSQYHSSKHKPVEERRKFLEVLVAKIEIWKIDKLKNPAPAPLVGAEFGIEGKEVDSKRTALLNKLENQALAEMKKLKLAKIYEGTALGANNSGKQGEGKDMYKGESVGKGAFVNHQGKTFEGGGIKFKTQYLSKPQKIRYRIYVEGGTFKDILGQNLDTGVTKGMSPGAAGGMIFVMSKSGKIYGADMVAEVLKRSDRATKEYVGFHHSSFLSGGEVAGAGEIQVSGGQLTMVSDASGHYKPKQKFIYQFLNELARKGVALGSNVIVNATGTKATTAAEFMAANQPTSSNPVPSSQYASHLSNNNAGQTKPQGPNQSGQYASQLSNTSVGQMKPQGPNQSSQYASHLVNNNAGQINPQGPNQGGQYASELSNNSANPQGSNQGSQQVNGQAAAPATEFMAANQPNPSTPKEDDPYAPYLSQLSNNNADQMNPQGSNQDGQQDNGNVQSGEETPPISLNSEVEQPEPQEESGEEPEYEQTENDDEDANAPMVAEMDKVEEDEEEEENEELE